MYCHEVLSTVLMLVVFDLVLGLSVTYDLGKNCDANLTMKCHFSGAFDATNTRNWLHPTVSDPILDKGAPTGSSGRYTEDITTSASSYFTMTITEVTLADAGNYFCEYIFDSANVTLKYECYDDNTVTIDCINNKVIITVDRVFPDEPTTTLTITNSLGNVIDGAVTSAASTLAGYTDHFKLTWTSANNIFDTNAYTVAIKTNAAGTLVTIADNLPVTCGLTTTQPTSAPPTHTQTSTHPVTTTPSKDWTPVIIGASAGGAGLLLLSTVIVVCCCIRKNRKKNKRKETVPMRDIDYESRPSSRVNSDQIRKTNRLTPQNSCGQTEIEEMEVRGQNEGIEHKAYDNQAYFGRL